MKKLITLTLALILALTSMLVLTSCNTPTDKSIAEKVAAGEELKIGIIQYMSHPSLANCYEGIKTALEESGIAMSIDYQIGSDTSADTDCSNFAQTMANAGYDMIFAIATPAAQSAFAATADTDIPVIFCAVSDPVVAKLVASNETPGDLCTGTSDVLDLEAQVDLILAMQPNAKKIGIIYTSSEANSLTNLSNFRAVCDARGLEVVASAVQNAADIPAAAENVASQVDCINNFTDNNVVNSLSIVLEAADKYHIPVYGSEEEQVKNGCLASVSIDYVALGKVTGQMALDVINGADITTLSVRTISDATPIVNTEVLATLGMTMPAGYANIATTTTNK